MSSVIQYDDNHYGKGCVKVAKVFRNVLTKVDEIKEFIVDIQLYGEFLNAYVEPVTNRNVIPTDTIKNTVYVLAKLYPMNNPVEFAIDVTEYFLKKFSHVSKVDVNVAEVVWCRAVLANNIEHTHGFVDKQTHQNQCNVKNSRDNGLEVIASITNLQLLKTRGSRFEGYVVDEYTTLKPAQDRIMSTKAKISWTYDNAFDLKLIDHNLVYKKVKQIAVDTFVSHDESKSLQHTIDQIARNALNSLKEMQSIDINCPNNHYLLSNIKDFGLENNNEIFLPSPEPYGNIFGKLSKSDYSIEKFNGLPRASAMNVVSQVSNSKKIQTLLVDNRHYRSIDDVLKKLEEIYFQLNEQDWTEEIKQQGVDAEQLGKLKKEAKDRINKKTKHVLRAFGQSKLKEELGKQYVKSKI